MNFDLSWHIQHFFKCHQDNTRAKGQKPFELGVVYSVWIQSEVGDYIRQHHKELIENVRRIETEIDVGLEHLEFTFTEDVNVYRAFLEL